MKRLIKFSVLTGMILNTALMTNCKDDFFDQQPDDQLNIETIFKNRGQAEGYWGGLFSAIPDNWDQPYSFFYSAITDEIDASNWVNDWLNNYNSGAVSASNVSTRYKTYYNKIRQCAIFLENIDKTTALIELEGGAERVKQYKAEAKFLRAYYYWLTMKDHGPVPIVPLESLQTNSDLQIPQSSWEECISFVMAQMEEAKADLPADYYIAGSTGLIENEIGRINKMIVDAVQSEITLFAASPLYNGNRDLASWKSADGKQLIPQDYDVNKWQIAAKEAKEAIDIAEQNGKALYKATDANPFRAAFLSVRNLYWDGWRTEGIFIRPSTNRQQWESHAAPRAVAGLPFNGLATFQELVDDFRMNDGLNIKESPQYIENTYATESNSYYVAQTNNMYANREPRFYAYITFNGSVIPAVARSGMTSVEFYPTGNSGKNGAPRDWPKTGYTARKNIHPTYSQNPASSTARTAMLIRLAELYLNYAEALNESNPGHADIGKYLNLVRNRAGLPPIQTGLSQDQMRREIHLERRIELCFEGKRYFDVRRWKLATENGYRQGGNYYGMNMNEGTSLNSPEFNKKVVAVSRREWNNRYYFLPWSQEEMDRNRQLRQIPGY